MKSLRRRSLIAAVGTASVAATLAGAYPAIAAPTSPRLTASTQDDDGHEHDCSDEDIAGAVTSSSVVRAADAADRTAAARAARATRAERAARTALSHALDHGTLAHQQQARAAYATAHHAAVNARRAAAAAHAALVAARRAVAAQLCGVTPPVTPPTPTPTPTPPPVTSGGAPTSLAANSASYLSNGAFRLSWSAVTGATSYEVRRDGALVGTTTATVLTPSVTTNVRNSYTVVAVTGTSKSAASAALSAGKFVGSVVADRKGLANYGNVQVSIVVTGKKVTGCWATYPTGGSSGSINTSAVPVLCSEAITAQSAAISSVSGASAMSTAFVTSLQDALNRAGI